MTTHSDSGEAPYGWRMVDGRIVADAIEQAIITRVCALRASGLSIRAIVAALTAEGVRTCAAEEHLRDNGVKLGGAECGENHISDRRIVDDITEECRLILARVDDTKPHVPYGWRLIDGCLVVDDGEQAVIAVVRASRDAGLSRREIFAELTLAGLITEGSR